MATSGEFDRARLGNLLRRDALRTGRFTLSSGKTSHYYVDGRKVTLAAGGAATVAEGVLDVLAGRPEVTAVGGLTLGADPIVGATLALAGLRGLDLLGFLVRKEPKGHGTGQLVEGPIGPGQVVAVVEDVTTTGGSALKAVDAVEAMGGRVACVITMLDRLEGAAEAFEARGLDFYALATIRELGVEPLRPTLDELPPIEG